jgi:hypothetical protein
MTAPNSRHMHIAQLETLRTSSTILISSHGLGQVGCKCEKASTSELLSAPLQDFHWRGAFDRALPCTSHLDAGNVIGGSRSV